MLTMQEINAYVYGYSVMLEKKEQFSWTEAQEIGNFLGIDWKKFDVEQFALGLNKELEHGRRCPQTNLTNDEPVMTGKIVLAHLNAIPDYYTRLAVMEREAR